PADSPPSPITGSAIRPGGPACTPRVAGGRPLRQRGDFGSPAWLASRPEAINSGARLQETPDTWARGCVGNIVAPVGTRPTTTWRNLVYDNNKPTGDSRPERRWWSRTAAAFTATAALVLAGPVAALGATTGHGSPAASAAVPGLGSASAAGSQL